MTDIVAYHADLLAQEYEHARPDLCEQPWGWREVHVTDPFGNKLRFAERMQNAS